MALRADSYSNVTSVLAFSRRFMDGQLTFNSTTRPTLTEVEAFIDRASGALNLTLAQTGLATPIVNSTAKLACADWVVGQAVKLVESTQPAAGENGDENQRGRIFAGLYGSAAKFAEQHALGFKRLGCTVSHAASEGLKFTGQTAQADRVDPDNTALEQPRFTKKQFDNEE